MKKKKKTYFLSLVDIGGAGHHRCHCWHCWPGPLSLSLLVAAVNAGSLGWGCHASLLSSTLGMGVHVMDVDSTEGESVSWVCAMGGCSPVMAAVVIVNGIVACRCTY